MQASQQPETLRPADICSVCGADLPPESFRTVADLLACANCTARIEAAIAAEVPPAAAWPTAVAAGAIGAALSGAVWAAIAVLTDFEVGLLATGIGFAAGIGVKLGARTAASKPLQWTAAALAAGGLLLGKYLLIACYLRKGALANGRDLGYLSKATLTGFPDALVSILTPYDALWLYLTVHTAYKLLAPSETRQVD